MASLFDFSSAISKYTRAKDYNTALSYFKEKKGAFRAEQFAGNDYLVSDILSCLRQIGSFDAAFKFLDIYNIQINETTKERILTAYGWLLFSKFKAENSVIAVSNPNDHDEDFFEDEDNEEVSDFTVNKSDLLKRIESLILLLRNFESDFAYTVLSQLFAIVIKTEKKKPAPNWRLINEFCELFDPNGLSTDCRTIEVERKGKKQDMELASDKENWFAYKSKALMKLGRYEECFDISKQGLELFEKLHYSNDAWFSRRVALSKKNLGNTEDTISELRTILRKKKEWFIQKELSELLFESGKTKEAFDYSIQAINNFGDLEFKIDLLYLIGKILNKLNDEDKAFKHFSLSKLIRQSKEWRTPQKLQDELNKFNQPEIKLDKLNELKRDLRKYWNSFKENDQTVTNNAGRILIGKIKNILNHNERGKNGFIEMNGNKYYFTVSANDHLLPQIETGKKVEFKVMKTNDGKEKARISKVLNT
jgi:tetratricopeptide (TPR) repeat protein